MTTRVKKVLDHDSHWYWIDENDLFDFNERLKKLEGKEYMDDPDAFDDFIELYDGYRTGGDPDNTPDPFDGNKVEFI